MSFHPWEGNPLINGNPKVVQFNTHFSKSKNFQSSTWPAIIVKDRVSFYRWVSFHPWEGNLFINRNPKVVQVNTHFSENEKLHMCILV